MMMSRSVGKVTRSQASGTSWVRFDLGFTRWLYQYTLSTLVTLSQRSGGVPSSWQSMEPNDTWQKTCGWNLGRNTSSLREGSCQARNHLLKGLRGFGGLIPGANGHGRVLPGHGAGAFIRKCHLSQVRKTGAPISLSNAQTWLFGVVLGKPSNFQRLDTES